VVVAVAIRAHETALAVPVDEVGEVRDHVAAIHLAVDEDVEADVLLDPDPLRSGLALELDELRVAHLPASVSVAGLLEVVGFPEGADRGREQDVV